MQRNGEHAAFHHNHSLEEKLNVTTLPFLFCLKDFLGGIKAKKRIITEVEGKHQRR